MIKDIVKIPYTTDPSFSLYEGTFSFLKGDPGFHREFYLEDSRFVFNELNPDLVSIFSQKLFGITGVSNSFEALACSIVPDFVLLHNGILKSACVTSPSGWVPSDYKNKDLVFIHSKVADSDRLVKASKRLFNTIANNKNRCYTRTAWTLQYNDRAIKLNDFKATDKAKSIKDLWFRVERQYTMPIVPNTLAAFFIHYDLTSLYKVQTRYVDLIRDSINSMSEAVLDYKNLRKAKEILNVFNDTSLPDW